MVSCGSGWDLPSSREPQQSISPRESRLFKDPYIIPTSIDDSILLKDASRSLLTPTPYPAPVLNPHDRDAVCAFSPDHARTFKLADSPSPRAKLSRALTIQCTSRTPSPLSALNTSPWQSSSHVLLSRPPSPISSSVSPAPTTRSYSPPLSPTPTKITRTTKGHGRRHTTVPEDFETLKNRQSHLLTPALPPPAYTQYAIGQRGGRKDPGAGRHWEWGPSTDEI